MIIPTDGVLYHTQIYVVVRQNGPEICGRFTQVKCVGRFGVPVPFEVLTQINLMSCYMVIGISFQDCNIHLKFTEPEKSHVCDEKYVYFVFPHYNLGWR